MASCCARQIKVWKRLYSPFISHIFRSVWTLFCLFAWNTPELRQPWLTGDGWTVFTELLTTSWMVVIVWKPGVHRKLISIMILSMCLSDSYFNSHTEWRYPPITSITKQQPLQLTDGHIYQSGKRIFCFPTLTNHSLPYTSMQNRRKRKSAWLLGVKSIFWDAWWYWFYQRQISFSLFIGIFPKNLVNEFPHPIVYK